MPPLRSRSVPAFVHPLSTTQVAANADGFTPTASASETAVAPQDCASSVFSASLLPALVDVPGPVLLPAARGRVTISAERVGRTR